MASSKVVCISGASSGLGLALATAFAARGDCVYGGIRKPADSAALPPGVAPLRLDVTRAGDVTQAIATIESVRGRLDVLVSNAGIFAVGPWELMPEAEICRLLEVNFFGAVQFVKAALPLMRRQGGGRIVIVSSLSGLVARPADGAYAASKFALEAFAESLAYEVRRFGIQVTIVNPGGYATGLTRNAWRPVPVPEDAYAQLMTHLPPQAGTGSVEQAAHTIVALTDDPGAPLRVPIDETGRRVFAALGLDDATARDRLVQTASGLGWWVNGEPPPA
jgi:NAD(P)-dependent dehydrogenase (short-subunit alcohol dehydrogenase family)